MVSKKKRKYRTPKASQYSLEEDLYSSDLVFDHVQNIFNFDVDLYRALCNNTYCKNNKTWACSFRYAGEIVSRIKHKEETFPDLNDPNLYNEFYTSVEDFNYAYMEYYCSGDEGVVKPQVLEVIESLGWTLLKEDD